MALNTCHYFLKIWYVFSEYEFHVILWPKAISCIYFISVNTENPDSHRCVVTKGSRVFIAFIPLWSSPFSLGIFRQTPQRMAIFPLQKHNTVETVVADYNNHFVRPFSLSNIGKPGFASDLHRFHIFHIP